MPGAARPAQVRPHCRGQSSRAKSHAYVSPVRHHSHRPVPEQPQSFPVKIVKIRSWSEEKGVLHFRPVGTSEHQASHGGDDSNSSPFLSFLPRLLIEGAKQVTGSGTWKHTTQRKFLFFK
jgi:hypothetical protein